MLRLLLIAAAVVFALVPVPPAVVERSYSDGLYPLVQSRLTAVSNLTPFAWFDVLIAGVLGWWAWRLVRDLVEKTRPAGWPRIAGRVVMRTATAGAALYLAFLAMWGLNYRRAPLVDKLVFDPSAVSVERGRELVRTAVVQLNTLYEGAHAVTVRPGVIDPGLVDAFDRAMRALGTSASTQAGRPKRTLLDGYFKAAGVDGMTDPYFLETLVASTLLPIERPFVLAHEWSHLGGIADEGEANFAGWVACMHGDEHARYSGWLFLYDEAARALPARDRAETSALLAAGPREDLRLVAERIRSHLHPVIATAGWRAYDQYLRANRVESGTASYAEVVRLVLGAKFDEGWTPRLK